MEKKTIGKFISALRKANGMTQKELGEKLFVSDKTVSRWECDECTPELSLIPSIAEIFNITTDELLRGERNNPDRKVADLEETASKQKARSEKQFKLMLHNRKKQFTNLSFISIGLMIVGLIAAMICNLGFSKGLLGFCLAGVFLVAATICQVCFTVSVRLLVDEEDTEHAENIKKANTEMVFASVKIFFGILLMFAFCLPIAVLTLEYYNSHYGLVLNSWLLFGMLFLSAAFLVGFCIYRIFILKFLIDRKIIWLNETDIGQVNTKRCLLKRICAVFLMVSAIIMLITYVVTENISESDFVQKQTFDNPNDFITYMQNQYDKWYQEGYGQLNDGTVIVNPDEEPEVDPDFSVPSYPSQSWGKIDGKEYYYCAHLYESVTILRHKYGNWEIIVITKDAYQNGQAMYSALNTGLLALHIINLLTCVLWYFIATKKQKPA